MDKKDIYEHLANIYLDASSSKKKKKITSHKFSKFIFSGLVVVFFLGGYLIANFHKHPANSLVSLVLYPDVVKINFNFDPAKKEIYSIDLKKLNLSHYKSIRFSAKKSNPKDNLALRVEFANIFNEKSFLYLSDLSSKWKEYTINFSDFAGVTDWTEMSNLAFIVEEWNAKENSDVIYIDNIRVLR